MRQAGPLPVQADQDRITQVLTNIIGNALAASQAGGAVTVEAVTAGPVARVVVTDAGVGLAEADLERVFERFYRAPGQPRRSAGSGIGLDDRPQHRPRARRRRHRRLRRPGPRRRLHPHPPPRPAR